MVEYGKEKSFIKSTINVGGDVVSIGRIKRLLNSSSQFVDYIFTSDEQKYCDQQRYQSQHYAARWAVKEAYLKSINRNCGSPNFRSIEVKRNPEPYLYLSGEELDILSEKAIARGSKLENVDIDISLSHDRNSGTALGLVVIYF